MSDIDPIKEIVENLQRALLKAGFNPGKIDGDMGGKTYKACIDYQRVGKIKEKKITVAPVVSAAPPSAPPVPVKKAKYVDDWRLAKSLQKLFQQVSTLAPYRNRDSDGTIGDKNHASRVSDHNPWIKISEGNYIVSAVDITHDPAGGCDCNVLAESIKSDPRVKYVIWNKRIYNEEISKKWRKYTGTNPHTKHMHVSVKSDQEHYDDESLWDLHLT